MYDGSALGHRRNMLNPSITTMGSGSIPSNNGFRSSESQLVLTTPSATRPAVRTGFVAWPPAGFVPYQVVYPRWSFSLPGADFSAATVTMQHNGSALPVQIRCVDPNVANDPNCGQFAEPAISWTPNSIADGADWPKPAADDPYTVTISNVVVNGVTQAPFTYTVTVIDPSVSDAAHTASVAPDRTGESPGQPELDATPCRPSRTRPATSGAPPRRRPGTSSTAPRTGWATSPPTSRRTTPRSRRPRPRRAPRHSTCAASAAPPHPRSRRSRSTRASWRTRTVRSASTACTGTS